MQWLLQPTNVLGLFCDWLFMFIQSQSARQLILNAQTDTRQLVRLEKWNALPAENSKFQRSPVSVSHSILHLLFVIVDNGSRANLMRPVPPIVDISQMHWPWPCLFQTFCHPWPSPWNSCNHDHHCYHGHGAGSWCRSLEVPCAAKKYVKGIT